MQHIFIDNKKRKTLVLFHGTGGSENDLIDLANSITNDFNILSLRGNVKENGMNRFFERKGFGIYNIESFKKEATNIVRFLSDSIERYHLDKEEVYGLGFSNGANMIEGILQNHENIFKAAVLLSPAFIDKDNEFLTKDINIFLATSSNDPYTSHLDTELLIKKLNENNKVNVSLKNIGHNLSLETINDLKEWFENIKSSN